MARNFNKFVKCMEKGGGYGHFRSECPLAKRKEQKCIECKGIGHTRSECPSILKKEKSLMCFSDTESESENDEGELHLNFMALIGQESGKDTDVDSEDDGDLEQDLEAEYKSLFNKFSDLSHENLALLKETAMLKAQVNILELDQPSIKTKEYSINIESDQEILALKRAMTEQERVRKETEAHVQRLSDLLAMEIDRSRLFESQLTENHKKVRMLSAGTASLDHILTLGQCPSLSIGLGYKGSTSTSTETKFVKEAPKEEKKPEEKRAHVERNKDVLPKQRRRGNGCHFCGKRGHNVRFCYFRRHQYERAWRLNLCFTEPTAYGCVWIAKRDLYPNFKENTHSKINTSSVKSHSEAEHDLVCNLVRVQVDTEIVNNVAYTSAEEASQAQLPWYFDSGCSKHMTGNEDYLEKLELIRGGKVTFGDGGQGKIRAIGITSRPDVPKLSNVYFVEGLKANLISVSQLCDEGLEVIFNSKECRAVDARNNVVLRAAESKLDLWHKKLGHMNTNGLFRLVNAEVVRGVPDLEKQTETVCGACCQGKQVKVQHKQISEIRSTRILELVHMDLMGPITPESIAGKRYIFVLVDDFSSMRWYIYRDSLYAINDKQLNKEPLVALRPGRSGIR
uniref:CCHC-type domain-containing protein n=1 Tax=Brassica oleracea var. oleracea TaxID=109376 RepID=A0A0D3BLB0_BRAOL